MRLNGLNPHGEAGRTYPTDYDTWRALLYVLHLAGGPVSAEHADFEGLPDEEEALALAQRLENFLDTHPDNLFVRHTDEERRSPSGRYVGDPGPNRPSETPPSISREQVQAFISFVRESGGFRVDA